MIQNRTFHGRRATFIILPVYLFKFISFFFFFNVKWRLLKGMQQLFWNLLFYIFFFPLYFFYMYSTFCWYYSEFSTWRWQMFHYLILFKLDWTSALSLHWRNPVKALNSLLISTQKFCKQNWENSDFKNSLCLFFLWYIYWYIFKAGCFRNFYTWFIRLTLKFSEKQVLHFFYKLIQQLIVNVTFKLHRDREEESSDI